MPDLLAASQIDDVGVAGMGDRVGGHARELEDVLWARKLDKGARAIRAAWNAERNPVVAPPCTEIIFAASTPNSAPKTHWCPSRIGAREACRRRCCEPERGPGLRCVRAGLGPSMRGRAAGYIATETRRRPTPARHRPRVATTIFGDVLPRHEVHRPSRHPSRQRMSIGRWRSPPTRTRYHECPAEFFASPFAYRHVADIRLRPWWQPIAWNAYSPTPSPSTNSDKAPYFRYNLSHQ